MKKMYKKISVLLTITMLLSIGLMGCTKETEQSEAKVDKSEEVNGVEKEKPVKLTFVLWNDFDYDYFMNENDLNAAYQKDHPNVTIEVEQIQPTEFDNTMKIRNSANQLPDIFTIRSSTLLTYKDAMVPLNDLEATTKNKFANDYAVDGNVLGLPQISFNEFVYYRKDIFEKYGLEIPTTWDEFVQTAVTIKEKGEYIPLLLGAKDAWTNYPFNEFMPFLEADNGKILSEMAAKDEPFAEGEPFNIAYKKIQKLYDANVCGDDPLGYGWDQQKAMFIAGEGAMLASGQWFAADYESMGAVKEDDLGIFVLPVRDTKDEKLNVITMADVFWGIPKTSKHIEESQEFINWFFNNTDDYYLNYITAKENISTIKGVEADVPFFKAAFEGGEVEAVVYNGGNAEYKRISDAISFDVKGMGQEMMAGKDLDEMMREMNEKWKAAKNK